MALVSQNPPPSEILVVDDASTDDSVRVVEQLAQRWPIIRLVRNERHLGCCNTLNRGAALARGRYLYLGAADDFVLPGFIAKLVGLLQKHPQAALSCAFPSAVMERSQWLWLKPVYWSHRPAYLTAEECIRRVGHRSPAGHTTIWRREAFLEVGGLLPDLEWLSDWFASLTASFRNGLCYVPEGLALFTRTSTSFSAQGQSDPIRTRQVFAAVLDRLRSEQYRDVAPAFARSGVMAVFRKDQGGRMKDEKRQSDSSFLLLPSSFRGLLARKVAEKLAAWLNPRTWLAWLLAKKGQRAVYRLRLALVADNWARLPGCVSSGIRNSRSNRWEKVTEPGISK